MKQWPGLTKAMEQWGKPKAPVTVHHSYSELKVKPMDQAHLAPKLRAIGAKVEAVRQLKAKNPHVDWGRVIAGVKKSLGL